MADPTLADRPKSRSVGPLAGVLPFLAPYRWQVAAALTALVLTAGVSLSLPLAVRRVVDGFSEERAALMDSYFAVAIVLAGVLALGTGLRFFLVTRLGERVVGEDVDVPGNEQGK